MEVDQWTWSPDEAWPAAPALGREAQLVLAFGDRTLVDDPHRAEALQRLYPQAHVVGASAGGEITGDHVTDGTLSVTALAFRDTTPAVCKVERRDGETDAATGRRLGRGLAPLAPDGAPLRHVLVFADGLHLNGGAFVRGMEEALPDGVRLTGGLAADGDRFERTVLWSDGLLARPGAVAVGLYSRSLRVGYGAVGGWDPFGPDRLVTRSEGAVLHRLDDRGALDLYKEYLGPHAEQLPASGLLFPLAIRTADGPHEIVRTALGTDEDAGTITFAGDVPEGAYARFMKTNVERIIDGALEATHRAVEQMGGAEAELVLLVSCVGRKWVLGQRTEEEVEGVAAAFPQARLAGFYSYGEVAPVDRATHCELHNQTMTVTTLGEG